MKNKSNFFTSYSLYKNAGSQLKGFNISKNNSKLKTISKGTCCILLKNPKQKNEYLEKIINIREDVPNILKKAIRWKNLRWILVNRKCTNINKEDQVEKLIKCYKEMKLYLQTNKKVLSKKNFNEFIEIILGKKDREFTENIFSIFDEDRDNVLDIKEMVIGLEIFRNDSYYSKMSSIK